jgi:hypothetical protein
MRCDIAKWERETLYGTFSQHVGAKSSSRSPAPITPQVPASVQRLIRSCYQLLRTAQITVPYAPAIHLDIESLMRSWAAAACLSRKQWGRVGRFYVKLTGSWSIFGDSPVDERIGDL